MHLVVLDKTKTDITSGLLRIQFNRLRAVGGGFIMLFKTVLYQTTICVGVNIQRINLQGLVKVVNRAAEVFVNPLGNAAKVIKACVGCIQFDGLAAIQNGSVAVQEMKFNPAAILII